MTQAPPRPRAPRIAGQARARAGEPIPWRPALILALRTVGLCVLAVECVVLVLWATEQGSTAGADGALRTGLAIWLAAHRTGFEIPGGHLGATPYTLTALPAILLWRGGGALVRMHGVKGLAETRRAVLAVTGIYATANVLLCFLAAQGAVRPIPSQALLGSAALAGLATAGGTLRASTWRPSLPGRLGVVVRGTGVAVFALLLSACAVTLVAVVVRHHAVTSTGHAVAPSTSGALGLSLLNVTALPTAVVWTASLLLGPGFGVGSGTGVSLAAANYGPVPGLPILAALPSPGPFAWSALLLLAFPVGAGGLAALRLSRGIREVRELVVRCAQMAVLTGAVFALLAWLADGPIGPGRLSVAGPSPWQIGLAAIVDVGGGALLVSAVQAIRWRRRRTG